MKLRNHPVMSYRGVSNWPPVWTRIKEDGVTRVTGEVGVLIFVHSNPSMPKKCFLVIDHGAEPYVGALIFDNQDFCKHVCGFLQNHLKRSIREIGDLDFPHTP
jgi:hypothetical protein